jgi:hypothetical protein
MPLHAEALPDGGLLIPVMSLIKELQTNDPSIRDTGDLLIKIFECGFRLGQLRPLTKRCGRKALAASGIIEE